MNFFCLALPIFCKSWINIITQGLWDLENAHCICRNCLSHCFNKYSCPTFEIYFSFHPSTHFVIYSFSSLKVRTLDLPATIGNPRYFSQSDMTWAPNIPCIVSRTSALVFLLKNRDVLSLFIAWPDVLSYCSRMIISCWHSSIDAWQNSKLSSVNSRWEIWTPFLQDKIPCNCFLSFALHSMVDIPSAHIKNK